jgi:hypothetical protein
MLKKITNKWQILSFGIGAIPSIIDWYQIIEHLAVYWMLIVAILILSFIVILIHHFITKSAAPPQKKLTNLNRVERSPQADRLHQLSRNTSISNDYHLRKNERDLIFESSKTAPGILWKIFILFFVFVLTLTITSSVYLKYKPIYYIRIENKNTKEEAQRLTESVNNDLNRNGVFELHAVVRRRSKSDIVNNYMVCINGGYLSKVEAMRDFEVIKDVLINRSKIELKQSTGTSFWRKIEYLKDHTNRRLSYTIMPVK